VDWISWLRIGASGTLLWTRQWTFWFHEVKKFLKLLTWSLPFRLTNFFYTCLISPVSATWPAPPIFLNLGTLVIFGKEQKLWSSSLCNFLHPHVTSSPLWPDIPLNTLFSTPSIHVIPLGRKTKFHTHIKENVKL